MKKMGYLLVEIQKFKDRISATDRGSEILQQVREGEITSDQAVVALHDLIKEEGILEEMKAYSEIIESLAPNFEIDLADLEDLEKANRPIFTETSTGIPQLNPLYEAAVIERSSIDGDVPEVRHGPLPKGGVPAVPVDTDVMDPVMIGMMLSRASDVIVRRLEKSQEALMETAEDLTTDNKDLTSTLPLAAVSVEGYEVGKPIPLMKVEKPSIQEINALTPEERAECVYKVLSTTQGRVSLCRPIYKEMKRSLEQRGFLIEDGPTTSPPTSRACWHMRSWGAQDLNSKFNFPAVAAASLVRDLIRDHEKDSPESGPMVLSVTPVNGISDRQFGWSATLSPLGGPS